MSAWRDFALCRGMDPDVFHPPPGDRDGVAAAIEICQGCPSRDACLEHALMTGENRGVWGGTSEHERRTIRRERTQAEAAA